MRHTFAIAARLRTARRAWRTARQLTAQQCDALALGYAALVLCPAGPLPLALRVGLALLGARLRPAGSIPRRRWRVSGLARDGCGARLAAKLALALALALRVPAIVI